MGDRPRQPHRPAPLRLAADREIDLARVRARRLSESPEQIERVTPDDPRVCALYRDFVRDEILAPLGTTLDPPALAAEAPPADLVPPTGELLLVAHAGTPVAIGGVRDLGTPVGEIKSMYVAPGARGRGIGRDLGYREIPAYNDGPNADLWLERSLD